jgi:hypothetical protein
MLTPDAKRVLDTLPEVGSRANAATVRKWAQLEEALFDAACSQLQEAGLIQKHGGRLSRTESGGRVAGLTPEAGSIFAALPADGSSIGGASLRSYVDLDNSAYQAGLEELRESGAITVRPGRGGSFSRTAPAAQSPDIPTLASESRRERDLYEPFVDWLKSSWPKRSEAFQEARVTATPRKYRRTSGTWSRPDVMTIRVERYDLLPQIVLEVGSYEIKPIGSPLVEWVFEAASHGKWAHRLSLVLEKDADHVGLPDERILGEIKRFSLGLYHMTEVAPARFEVKQIIEPALQSPEPADLDEAIERFLSEDRDLLNRYKGFLR